MNVGHWIVVSFVLFAAFIGVLVTLCMKEDISLVSKDYYQEEINYQDQIDRIKNTSELKEKPEVKVVANYLQIQFNDFASLEKGELKLFCPSNSAMDRIFRLDSMSEAIKVFELGTIQRGAYRAKFRWKMNGKEYYQENVIYI